MIVRSSKTPNIKLFKWNVEEDGEEDFDIEKSLNDNWDKIDAYSIKTDNNIVDLQTDNILNKTEIENIKIEQETQNININNLITDNETNKNDISNIKTEQETQNTDINILKTDNTTNKQDIVSIKSTLQALENIGEGEEGLIATIINLQNSINAKLDIPKRKALTLLSTNWTLNSATNKYEYIIEDSNITENDFPDCALSEEGKKKISDLDQHTENGRLILTTSKQVTENINMTVVLIRTIAEGSGT